MCPRIGRCALNAPDEEPGPNSRLVVGAFDGYGRPGAKGIGELGAVGVSAAVANAVFHATGTRVRDLPIGIHHLL